jgi:tRNA threonylcarbamoyladenosine biosynthesis protein TsaB
MLVLVFDTALETCSAAIAADGRVLAARSEPMARGHQERLAPLVEEVAREAGVAFPDLDRIGVTRGPGSFTGLRVGLAFAKGLGFSLGRPVVGIGVLEALAAGAPGVTAAVIDARRGQVYLQAFDGGVALTEAEALSIDAAVERLTPLSPGRLTGPGARLLSPALPHAEAVEAAGVDPAALARLAAAAREPLPGPEPLYLRAPDAKLPA